jgi:hypothetical protein
MANFFQDTINKARETFDKGYKTFIKPIIQAKNDFVADIRPGGYVGFTGQTAESLKPIVPVVQKAASQAWKDTSNAYQQVANQARKTIDPIVQKIPKSNILGFITKPFLNTAKDFTSATAETLQSTVDPKKNFVDPYKRMLFSGGKLAASPLAVANPLQTLAQGGLSGGINQVFGDKNDPYRFAKGVGEGISSAGAYKAIGMLTNPMINKISKQLMKSKTVLNALSKVPAGKKRDFINFLAERAAVGTLNIPEGVVMQKAVIPDAKYTVQDALIDFTLGAAVGKTGIRSAMQGDQNIKFSNATSTLDSGYNQAKMGFVSDVSQQAKGLDVINKYLNYNYGKTHETATQKQIEKALKETDAIIFENKNNDVLKKIGSLNVDISPFEKKQEFFYGGISRNMFTNGYFLINDHTGAKKINDVVMKKMKSKEINELKKDYRTSSLPFEELDKLADTIILNKIEKAKREYAPVEEVINEVKDAINTYKPAIIQGYYKDRAVLTNGIDQVAVNKDYLRQVMEYLPNTKIMISSDNITRPVAFLKGDDIAGLLMPIKTKDGEIPIPKPIDQNYAPESIKYNQQPSETKPLQQAKEGIQQAPKIKKPVETPKPIKEKPFDMSFKQYYKELGGYKAVTNGSTDATGRYVDDVINSLKSGRGATKNAIEEAINIANTHLLNPIPELRELSKYSHIAKSSLLSKYVKEFPEINSFEGSLKASQLARSIDPKIDIIDLNPKRISGTRGMVSVSYNGQTGEGFGIFGAISNLKAKISHEKLGIKPKTPQELAKLERERTVGDLIRENYNIKNISKPKETKPRITKMSNVDGADVGALKQLKEVAKRQLERIKQLKTQIKDSPINQQNSLKVQLLKAQSNYEYTKQSIVDLEKQITKRASELGQITKLNKTNNFSKSQLTDIRNKANQQAKPQKTTPPLSTNKDVTSGVNNDITSSQYPIIKKQPIVPSQPPTTFSDQKSIDLSQQKPTEPEGIQLQKPPKGSGEGVPPQKPPKGIGEGSPPTKPPAQEGDSSVDGFISKLKAKFNKLYTETVNEFHPLNYVAKMAGKAKEMRHALAGYYGAGSTAQYHVDFELTQILKEQNLNDLREAAIAMRDIELASRGIKGSPKQKQALEKLKAIKERLGEEKMKSIGETLKKLYEYQDRMVKTYLVDTGIMSQIGYKNMRKNNNFYIPFKRVMDRVDEFLGFVPPSKGAGSVSSQDVIYSIKGSDKEIVDPIESILEATYKMVALAKRQEVAQTIVSLKDDLPEGMIKEIKGKVGNTPNISLFVNGKVKHYQVPIEVAEAAKGLNKEALATVFRILQYPTAVFRASATGSNPDFFVPNVLIDLQSAFVNAGLNPLKWVKGLAHMMKKDEIYQEFLKQGAKSTTRVAIDRPMLQKTVAEIAGDTKSKAIEVLKPSGLLKVLQTISEYSETPTRIAVFEEKLNEGLKKGLSREEALKEAAYWAQEATTNFSRHGSKTQAINALYAFLNARLQGVDRLLRSFKNDPVGVGFRVGLISQVPALVLYAWNRQFESYNDERVVSETDKKRKFIFMLSDTPIPQLGGAQYIAIPKGDIGQLANPTEEFLRMADNKGGDVKNALVDVLKAFSPVSNVGDILPTALRPIIEVAANKNFFFDKEIVPEYKKAYPAKYQDTAYTRPLYRMIGDKINASPAKIEALVHGYGTGLANIGERMTRPFIPDKYKTPQNEQGATINQIPVLRRFLGGERKTKEEQELAIAKRIKAIEFDINDIKGGIKRKEIPQEEGLKQIEVLQAQQQELKNKLGDRIPESFFTKSRRIRLRKVRSKRLRSKRRFTSKRIKVKRLRIRRPSFA